MHTNETTEGGAVHRSLFTFFFALRLWLCQRPAGGLGAVARQDVVAAPPEPPEVAVGVVEPRGGRGARAHEVPRDHLPPGPGAVVHPEVPPATCFLTNESARSASGRGLHAYVP